jgi:hypothetical protein
MRTKGVGEVVNVKAIEVYLLFNFAISFLRCIFVSAM